MADQNSIRDRLKANLADLLSQKERFDQLVDEALATDHFQYPRFRSKELTIDELLDVAHPVYLQGELVFAANIEPILRTIFASIDDCQKCEHALEVFWSAINDSSFRGSLSNALSVGEKMTISKIATDLEELALGRRDPRSPAWFSIV